MLLFFFGVLVLFFLFLFTISFNQIYANLLMAPKERLNTGLISTGMDARIVEI